MAVLAATFSAIACTLLVLGVLWGLAHIFREVAGDRIFRRRATWRFSIRTLLIGVAASSVIFGLLRQGIDFFFSVIVGLIGLAAFGAVMRLFFLALSPQSQSSSISPLRKPSQPIGPPATDEASAAAQHSEEPSARKKREPRKKWWLSRHDPTLPTNVPRF